MNMERYQIDPIQDTDLVNQCATMMVSTDPWKVLGFTFEKCLSTLQMPQLDIFGVVDAGQVQAFIATLEYGFGFEPMIEFLCVDNNHRSQGLGSALIKHATNQLFSEQKRLYLTVSDINPRAMALYIRLGFQPVGVLPDYNEPGQTEYLLRKDLKVI